MSKVNLYTRSDKFVVSVLIPGMLTANTVLFWGNRVFTYTLSDGLFRESPSIRVFTEEEHASMMRDGIVT